MAELNFGLLTPPGSESIGNAFVRGQDQAQASQMQNLQMQQATRKGQMDELTYKKALDTESRLNKYYANIAANGGPKTALEAENAMIGSGIPHIADMGAKAQLLRLQNESDLALFTAAKTEPTAAPAVAPMAPAVAPAVAPEPGSFGADVAERRAADPFAPAPRTNMMDGAAPAAAPANNLGGRTIDNMKAERDRMLRVPGKAAERQIAILNADIALAAKESPDIATMRALGYPNTQAGYAAFRAAQRQNRLLTPDEEAQEIRIGLARRPPAQPPAPSTQTIADPTDPTKAIVIDTRQYRPGGGINSPGVFGYAPPAKTAENIREEELKTAYNTNRILNSAVQIGKILKKTPGAAQPGGLEASATAMFGNAGVANLVRSENRQIVAAAQSDIIDSLLYLATGAAYNKEQLAQQRQSYLPAFTDEPGTVAAKQDALRGLIDGAKVRSGRAWTPKMQSAVDLLTGGAATPAAAAAAPALSAADQQALTWATANPKDPRSAQIKQRLGR